MSKETTDFGFYHWLRQTSPGINNSVLEAIYAQIFIAMFVE